MSTTATQTTEALLSKLSLTVDKDKAVPPYKYADYLPHYAPVPKQQPLTPFDHVDIGHEALSDPEPESFLAKATLSKISPKFGVEVKAGVDLTTLSRRERAQLALYVAKRGVVVFRGQEAFIDADPQWQIEDWGRTWGRILTHPVSGPPKDHPQLHVVHYELGVDRNGGNYKNKLCSNLVHSDASAELQPAGMCTLFLYTSPESGGDTLYINTVEAYRRLSPSFAAYLETLTAVHSGQRQADLAREFRGEDAIRRDPVWHEHPLVRRHPVTGEKALFVNPGFTTHIVGLKQEESDAILKLLYAHLTQGHDFQIRARWGPGTVVMWDNRITCHSALVDWDDTPGLRHGARITAQAERPFLRKEEQ